MKRVPIRVWTLTTLFAATVCAYLVSPANSAWYWQCPIHAWTGLLCPGCGGTRAVHALLHGEFTAALLQNPLAVLLFVGGWAFVAAQWCVPRPQRLRIGSAAGAFRPQIVAYSCALIAAFTLLRNLGF